MQRHRYHAARPQLVGDALGDHIERAFGEVQAVLQDGLTRRVIVQNAAYAQERLTVATRLVTDDR